VAQLRFRLIVLHIAIEWNSTAGALTNPLRGFPALAAVGFIRWLQGNQREYGISAITPSQLSPLSACNTG
jgi:hypothetical protein